MADVVNHDRAYRWCALPGIAFLAAMTALPLLLLVRVSLCAQGRGFYEPGTWTLEHYRSLAEPDFLGIVAVTAAYALAIAGTVVVVALPVALWVASGSARLQVVSLSLIVLPKFASVLAILFGWQQLLSSAGPFARLLVRLHVTSEAIPLNRNPFAALLAEVSSILPYAILILIAQRRRIDPRLAAVAAGLGASTRQILTRVTLPLMGPGLRAVALLSLIWGLGCFTGPLLLAGPESTTLAVRIHKTALESGRWPLAAAQSVVLLSSIAIPIGIASVALRRKSS